MSLFKTEDKWRENSKKSIEGKEKLLNHRATYPQALKGYDSGRAAVQKITEEIEQIHKMGGSALELKTLNENLQIVKRERDRPLHNYKLMEASILREMEALTSGFISEKHVAWRAELQSLPFVTFREVSHTQDVEGHRVFTIESNMKAMEAFKQKLLSSLNTLRDMKDDSIPSIEAFISRVENELKKLDLSVETFELSELQFADMKEGLVQRQEDVNPDIGFGLKDGIVLLEKGMEKGKK